MHPLGFRSVASLNNLTQPWRTLCPIWQFAAYAAFCFLQMARPHTNVLKFCKPKYAKNRRCYRYTQCYRYKIMATIYRRCRRCFLFRFTPFYAFFPFLLREQLFQFFNNCSLYFVLSNLAVMFVTEFSTSNYSLHACWLTPFHAACTTVVHKLTFLLDYSFICWFSYDCLPYLLIQLLCVLWRCVASELVWLWVSVDVLFCCAFGCCNLWLIYS